MLFTFQSPYLFTIGRTGVLSLAGWAPHVQSGFHEPRPTQSPTFASAYRTVTFCGRPFQIVRLCSDWLIGLIRVRSPLLTESRLISFPPCTEMFQFPGFARTGLYIQPAVIATVARRGRVSPFGDPRIKVCLATPRGFSQPTTSFFASARRGIHHAPLLA